MFEPTHMPNKLEIKMAIICIFISGIVSVIVFPVIVQSDKFSITAILTLFIIIFLMVLLALQSIFNLYYQRYLKGKKK